LRQIFNALPPLAAYRCPNKKADGYAVYAGQVLACVIIEGRGSHDHAGGGRLQNVKRR
jgi:hypothetical protein